MDTNKERFCRICISSYENCTQLISIFGEDSLWKKITTFADVKIDRHDTLPQHVCIACAKNTISACLFKKKCEDADNFFRQQLLIQKIESKSDISKFKYNQIHENKKFVAYENGLKNEDEVKKTKSLLVFNDTVNIPIVYSNHINDDKTCEGKVELDNESEGNDISKQNFALVQNTERSSGNTEMKCFNKGKLTLGFEPIRLMHEYMQQQLNKLSLANKSNREENGLPNTNVSDNDEDEPLPIMPEVEIITPSDETDAGALYSNVDNYMNDNVHMKSHQCPHCFQIFEMKQILKAHMQTIHNALAPVYECSHCKKTYFYKRFLEKHIRRGRCVKKRRNQTKPMQCSDCHVLFPTGHHLGWHKRTGCPSKTTKMPLQQFFKQNIVQYNNFPKRNGARKLENAIYLHNRKLIIGNNKRKGRTRIKLDAKKIALAKQLILRDATTTVIANELNISRTFAWRLRKSLVNGISLHERVVDPVEEEDKSKYIPIATIISEDKLTNEHQNLQECIKTEIVVTDAENSVEDDTYFYQNISILPTKNSQDEQQAVPTSVIQRNDQAFETSKTHDHIQQKRVQSLQQFCCTTRRRNTSGNQLYEEMDGNKSQLKDLTENNIQKAAHQQQYFGHSSLGSQILNNSYENVYDDNTATSIVSQFIPIPSAPNNPLPVNLSVRPISDLQNIEKMKPNLVVGANRKKPRKPNVFIDDEKYALAKQMMAQSASTMEIARALNVSQMTAWKVRDAIIKGIPLTYRGKQLQMSNHIDGVDDPEINSSYRNLNIETATINEIHKNFIEKNHFKSTPNLRLNNIQQQENQRVQLQEKQQVPRVYLKKPEFIEQTKLTKSQKIIKHRFKTTEREVRDKEITSEILELIKEDSNIQYWKVSARLAEKGYAISPSSVCQKLKSLGFHRRWKPRDKPPQIDMKNLKTTNNIENNILQNLETTHVTSNTNSSSTQQFEHQKFEIGDTHFLSALTH